jgi:hypothetical protein
MIKFSRRGVCSGIGASLLADPLCAIAKKLPGSITVNGRFLEPDRQLLRGVAMGDALLRRGDRPISDYGHLVSVWALNTVRISVHPGTWSAQRDQASKLLDVNVEAALQLGLTVIIDWHAIGWPGGDFERPLPNWGQPSNLYDTDIQLATDFWIAMAERYQRQPRVIFELWNEPVMLLPKGRRPRPGEDWAMLAPVWSALTAEIRKRAQNLVLATGGSWASDLTGVRDALLADENTAYAWHVYPGTASGGGKPLDQLLDGLDEIRPVFVTEWGFSNAPGHLQGTAQGFGTCFASDFLKARRLHWTAWCWVPDWEPALISPDWRTPTESGELVIKLLHED